MRAMSLICSVGLICKVYTMRARGLIVEFASLDVTESQDTGRRRPSISLHLNLYEDDFEFLLILIFPRAIEGVVDTSTFVLFGTCNIGKTPY